MIHGRDTSVGLVYALVAYIWWGLMPLYLRRIGVIPATEILCFRIVTSVPVLAFVLLAARRCGVFLQTFRRPAVMRNLAFSTMLVGWNWYVYTYAVVTNQAIEASLGYYIQPLLNAALGASVFRERFRAWQIVALGIAMAGVVALVIATGSLPLIAISLAISFGLYSTVRKATPVDGLVGLSVEVMFLLPLMSCLLLWWDHEEQLTARTVDATTIGYLMASGFVTAVPLVCFGQAARRLRLSTLGFLQYISPTLQLIIAVAVFGESFSYNRIVGFAIVWLALIVYTLDALRAARQPNVVTAPQ